MEKKDLKIRLDDVKYSLFDHYTLCLVFSTLIVGLKSKKWMQKKGWVLGAKCNTN